MGNVEDRPLEDVLTQGVDPARPGADTTVKTPVIVLPPEMVATGVVLHDVALEREKQDVTHGGAAHDDTHSPLDWESFRAEYEKRIRFHRNNRDVMRDALVKIAALAIAQIEALDREVTHG